MKSSLRGMDGWVCVVSILCWDVLGRGDLSGCLCCIVCCYKVGYIVIRNDPEGGINQCIISTCAGIKCKWLRNEEQKQKLKQRLMRGIIKLPAELSGSSPCWQGIGISILHMV